jgi:succinate dehydrogenase / fumarate reductase cytochrome b subunit
VLETGAGYDLAGNKRGAILTMVGSVLLTLIFWGFLFKDVLLAKLGAK